MVSRKSETLELSALQVGASSTREQIAKLGRVSPLTGTREWTGIVEFENCIVLFVTLDKGELPIEHSYQDYFEDELFYWESQNRNTQNSPVILRLLSGDPVVLFCRLHATSGRTASPFVYCGRLACEDYQDERPVKIRYVSLDYRIDAGEPLAELYAWKPTHKRLLTVLEAPDDPPKRSSGQGRVSDAKKRKVIERFAMTRAVAHYETGGYMVEDTSANSPYDLVCSRANGPPVRVEVKGLTGEPLSVFVTIGEVNSARDPSIRTDLFIVHGIQLEVDRDDYRATGGEVRLVEDWLPEESSLSPVQYRYSLK